MPFPKFTKRCGREIRAVPVKHGQPGGRSGNRLHAERDLPRLGTQIPEKLSVGGVQIHGAAGLGHVDADNQPLLGERGSSDFDALPDFIRSQLESRPKCMGTGEIERAGDSQAGSGSFAEQKAADADADTRESF